MEWIQIAVIILSATPSAQTINPETFSTIETCEGDLMRTFINEDSSTKKMKTMSFNGFSEQIVITKPFNVEGYGKGSMHYSCIPISE